MVLGDKRLKSLGKEDKLKQYLPKNTRLAGWVGDHRLQINIRNVYPTLIAARDNNGRGLRHHFISRLDCCELYMPKTPLKHIPRGMIHCGISKYHLFINEWPQINHPAPIRHSWCPSSCLVVWSPGLLKIGRTDYRSLRIAELWGDFFFSLFYFIFFIKEYGQLISYVRWCLKSKFAVI